MLERPRECKDVIPSAAEQHDASREKLSRPQKRRKRLQQLAAHRAVATSSGKPQTTADFQDVVVNYLDKIVSRLGVLESLHAQSLYNGMWFATANPMAPGMHLNSAAPAFFPSADLSADPASNVEASIVTECAKGVHRGEAASTIQRVWRGHCARQTLRCRICHATVGQCVCSDLLCSQCFRSADVCACELPEVLQRKCTKCGWLEDLPAHHGDQFLAPTPTVTACVACGGLLTFSANFQWLTPSDNQCGTCLRRDNQRSIQPCNGRGCDGLHHKECMASASLHASLCNSCVDRGVAVGTESSSDSSDVDEVACPESEEEALQEAHSQAATQDGGEAGRCSVICQLDSRLDQMLQFCEAIDKGQLQGPHQLRDLVLQAIKETMAWKKADHPKSILVERVAYLDELMTNVIRKIHAAPASVTQARPS